MDGFTSSSSLSSGSGGGGSVPSDFQLNQEQLHHLMNKLSSDEQKGLQETLQKCTSEIIITRGIPFSTLVVGSLYFARTRLPKQYHFGPKGWPFYAFMGIGAMTTANIFGMSTCRDRVRPQIHQLWAKYGGAAPNSPSYDELRQQNRQGGPPSGGGGGHAHPYQQQFQRTEQDSSPAPVASFDYTSRPPMEEVAAAARPAPARPAPATFLYDAPAEPVMSGTPTGRKTQYGDSGFS